MIIPLRKAYVLAAFLGIGIAPSQTQAAVCSYKVDKEWTTGFTGTITINNNGNSAINRWTVGWKYTANKMTRSWNATISGTNPYTATGLGWNSQIQPGQSASFGFQGDKNGGAAETPAIMGAVCSGGVSSSSVSSRQRMGNPFVGAVWYVDPKWQDNVLKEPHGSSVANYSTAVWIDRIGAIAPTDGTTWGLAAHLDNAISQKANLIEVVIYDLPNRDCNALASNGELLIAKDGFNRYKKEYITPIVKILSDVKYKDLRIIAIIEPDSLPNLVTNTSVKKCQEAAGAGGYVEATQFTLNSLYPISNVYGYVDIGHSGWLGWDDLLNKSATFIATAIKGTANGVNSVAGFISNTANYTPLNEPFLDEFSMSAMSGSNGSIQVRQAKFYEWNPHYSELAYAQVYRAKMISLGFPSTIGMLIDTSRNGWGGANRPKALSTDTNVDTFVDQSRIDRRVHRGMWCNQPGGIGERPTATPEPGIDAYVWIKPPGESDGVASAGIIDPTDPAKGFDRFCDPTYIAPDSGGQFTGAMPGAPHAGHWFSAGFKVLIDNAYPPLK